MSFFSPHLNFDRLGFSLIGCGNTLLILALNFYCSCLKIEVLWSKKIKTFLDHCPFSSDFFFMSRMKEHVSNAKTPDFFKTFISGRTAIYCRYFSFNFTTLTTFTTKMTCFAIKRIVLPQT